MCPFGPGGLDSIDDAFVFLAFFDDESCRAISKELIRLYLVWVQPLGANFTGDNQHALVAPCFNQVGDGIQGGDKAGAGRINIQCWDICAQGNLFVNQSCGAGNRLNADSAS